MAWLVIGIVAAAFLLATPFVGADSRDGLDWRERRPGEPNRRTAIRPASASPLVLALRRRWRGGSARATHPEGSMQWTSPVTTRVPSPRTFSEGSTGRKPRQSKRT